MKKIKEFLLSQNFVLITFILLGARAIAVEPGIGFALTVASFAGLLGFRQYLDSKVKPDLNATVLAELEQVKANMSGIMMKNASRPAQMQQEIKRFF